MAYAAQFGSYVLPSGWAPVDMSLQSVVPVSKLPRSDGGYRLPGTLGPRRVVFRGTILRSSSQSWRQRVDDLLHELHEHRGSSLYVDSDRYLRSVDVEAVRLAFEPPDWGRVAEAEIEFIAADPFFYAAAETTNTETVAATGETWAVTVGNYAHVRPTFEITVGGSGAETIAFTITNNTTGEAFTLDGDVTAADVIVVDCLARTVVIGATDKMSLFEGVFPRLDVGANTLQEDYTSSEITQVVTKWRTRAL
jgi:phage-related protein